MIKSLLFLLIQAAPQPVQVRPIYQKPINDTLILVVTAEEKEQQSQLRFRLLERRGSKRLLVKGGLLDKGSITYKVLRADDSSLVIARAGHYMPGNSVKFFFSNESQTGSKQIEYAPDIGLGAVDDREVAAMLDVPEPIVQQLKAKPMETHGFPPDSSYLPEELRDHPMPQSTYAEFARARPARVRDGYDQPETTIQESPGPYYIAGTRIWFGKIFYDGEGTTGVGGIGYFDTKTSRYVFVRIPMLTEWSVSALLIEDQTAWIGLVGYPEGAPYPAGLLHHNLRSGVTGKLATEDVVNRIVRWKDRVYVSTTKGGYQIRDGVLTTRYLVEPNRDNRFVLVSESLSAKSNQ